MQNEGGGRKRTGRALTRDHGPRSSQWRTLLRCAERAEERLEDTAAASSAAPHQYFGHCHDFSVAARNRQPCCVHKRGAGRDRLRGCMEIVEPRGAADGAGHRSITLNHLQTNEGVTTYAKAVVQPLLDAGYKVLGYKVLDCFVKERLQNTNPWHRDKFTGRCDAGGHVAAH